MRQIIVIFLFAVTFCYSLKPQINADSSIINPYVFEDLINSTIEADRPNIPDPLLIETLDINLPDAPDAVLTGNGTISKLNLTGLQGFSVSFLSFELGSVVMLNVTVGFGDLSLYTDFNLNLSLSNLLGIYGEGNISVNIGGLEIQGSSPVNLTGGISIHDLRLQISIGTAEFKIHGLFDDEDLSDLLSSLLNDLAVKFIDENQELVTETVSPLFEGVINSILADLLAPTTVAPTTDGLH